MDEFLKNEIDKDYKLGDKEKDTQIFKNTTNTFDFEKMCTETDNEIAVMVLTPYQTISAYTPAISDNLHDDFINAMCKCVNQNDGMQYKNPMMAIKCHWAGKKLRFIPQIFSKEITTDMLNELQDCYHTLDKLGIDYYPSRDTVNEHYSNIQVVDNIPNLQEENNVGNSYDKQFDIDQHTENDNEFLKNQIDVNYDFGDIEKDTNTFKNTTKSFNVRDFYCAEGERLGTIVITPYQVIATYGVSNMNILHSGLDDCIRNCISGNDENFSNPTIAITCCNIEGLNMFIPEANTRELPESMMKALEKIYIELEGLKESDNYEMDENECPRLQEFKEFNNIKISPLGLDAKSERIIGIPLQKFLEGEKEYNSEEDLIQQKPTDREI